MLSGVIIVMRVVVVGIVGGRLAAMIEPMIRDGWGRRRQGAAGRGRRIAPRSGDGDADEDGGARTCMLLESEDRWEGA
jgi:hypothetical protein